MPKIESIRVGEILLDERGVSDVHEVRVVRIDPDGVWVSWRGAPPLIGLPMYLETLRRPVKEELKPSDCILEFPPRRRGMRRATKYIDALGLVRTKRRRH